MADKLNFIRYLSHFRCVHRGAAFAKMRTTTVRRLLPESWGFLCPVHTPDGEPCGLMNHLTAICEVVTQPVYTASVPALLCNLGMWCTVINSHGWSYGFLQVQSVRLCCLEAGQGIPARILLTLQCRSWAACYLGSAREGQVQFLKMSEGEVKCSFVLFFQKKDVKTFETAAFDMEVIFWITLLTSGGLATASLK